LFLVKDGRKELVTYDTCPERFHPDRLVDAEPEPVRPKPIEKNPH
jgi:hypothetical protein